MGITTKATLPTLRRRAAEAALREYEEKYRNLFQLSRVGITTLDFKGVITSCNPAVYDVGGYSEGEIVGKHFTKIAPVRLRDIPKFLKVFHSIIRGKVPEPFEVTYNRKDGTIGWTKIRVSLLKAGSRKIGIQVLQRDITERSQAGDNLGKTSDEDRSKEQDRLASLQKRFVRLGFDALEEEDEIRLVFSLCRYHPECDEEIEKCIKNFKDLRELLSASEEKLQRIGICPRGVFAIRLLRKLPEEVLKQKILERSVYKSPQEIFDYLRYSMRDLEKEVFKVIYLDKRDKIIDTVDLFEGTLDSIPIRPREIMESAIAHNATALIFAHNHPTGDLAPSRTDKQLTRELVFVGMIMQIKVLDHIIIGEDRYFSFADDKLIEKYEDDFLNLRIRAAFDIEVQPRLAKIGTLPKNG